MGIGLLALGIRLMRREYRPLGQGLAAAGLAGLYTASFAAHGLYDLVPREVSALLMVAVTVAAVLLALRLDARLLAALAWTGGYMTPLLLSTGEDRAVSLFVFLVMLGAGALVIDHRKPWPETAPLAMMGTVLLYSGWYAKFFRPERFEVAAAGLLVLTALFAFGMARKGRTGGFAAAIALASIGVCAMAISANRPLPLLVLSLLLGSVALRAATTMGKALAGLALVAVALPYAFWWGSHYRPDSFGIAALWVLAAAVLLLAPAILGEASEDTGAGVEPPVLIGGAMASAALCASTDRPLEIALFLAGMAGLAALLRKRRLEAEVLAIAGAALSVGLWIDRFFTADRAGDAYLVAMPAVAVFAAALLSRGLLARRPVVPFDVLAHLLLAGFTWCVLLHGARRVAPGTERPRRGGDGGRVPGHRARRAAAPRSRPAARARGARPCRALRHPRHPHPARHPRSHAGLGRGRRGPARAGDALRIGARARRRLFRPPARLHAPAGRAPAAACRIVRPVFNPVFGTWLAVVAAFGAALWVTRGPRRRGPPARRHRGNAPRRPRDPPALRPADRGDARHVRATAAACRRAGDAAASQTAARVGGLAVSVFWTVFSTALLAAGLAARSRALFYAAYGLFALTAAKVSSGTSSRSRSRIAWPHSSPWACC